MKTVAYIRTSTKEQNISLDVQREKIAAMASVRDVVVDEFIVEQESAKSLNRPGMTRLLAMVDAGEVSTVLIAKLDRLTRSVADLSDLVTRFARHNVALVSVAEFIDTSTAGGRMVVNMLGVIAQWERETISERVTAAMRHQKAEGKVYCHRDPYGYERNGERLMAVEAEQAVIRRIFAWSNAGISLLSIARKLNGSGVICKNGGSWHASTVRAILRNSVHQGTAQTVTASTVVADVQSALENLGMPRSEAAGYAAEAAGCADLDTGLRAALAARNARMVAA